MNGSTPKKRARELQAITGMPYQSALRAVIEGTEPYASIRSGLTSSDFVTPRELRIWHEVNRTGQVDCANGRHWMPNEHLGQCVGCGAYLSLNYDDYGDSYELVVDEDRFFEECLAAEYYANWAPPLALLDGKTQSQYFRENWRPLAEDLADLDLWGTTG